MNIPVCHDDQHGTAIVVGAAMLNALKVSGKDITQVKLVASGAGTATLLAAILGAALMSLLWHGLLAVAFSAGAVARFYRRIQRGFDAVLGTVLAGLGVRLLGAD